MALERVPVGYSQRGRRRAHGVRSSMIREIMADGQHSGDGQGAHRTFRGGPKSCRRSKSTTSMKAKCSRRPTKRTTSGSMISSAVRMRRAQSGRSAAAHRRRRGHDSHQGRSRLGQHRRGSAAYAHDRQPNEEAHHAARGRIGARGQGTSAPRWIWSEGWPRPESCRCRISRRVASPLRPTRRWFGALVRKRFSSAPDFQDRAIREARAKAIVKATTHFEDARIVLEAHEELGEAMPGLDVRQLEEKDLLSTRGW